MEPEEVGSVGVGHTAVGLVVVGHLGAKVALEKYFVVPYRAIIPNIVKLGALYCR